LTGCASRSALARRSRLSRPRTKNSLRGTSTPVTQPRTDSFWANAKASAAATPAGDAEPRPARPRARPARKSAGSQKPAPWAGLDPFSPVAWPRRRARRRPRARSRGGCFGASLRTRGRGARDRGDYVRCPGRAGRDGGFRSAFIGMLCGALAVLIAIGTVLVMIALATPSGPIL
jgi:hypothetical protein